MNENNDMQNNIETTQQNTSPQNAPAQNIQNQNLSVQAPPPNIPTKLCKHCKSPINKKATICPVCNQKQRAGSGCLGIIIKTLIVLVTIFVFFSLIVSACSKSVKDTIDEKEKEREDKKVSADTLIYDSGGIKITYTGMEDSYLTSKINLKIENNTDKSICVQIKDFSIDNYSMTEIFSCDVASHKIANDSITISHSDLESNKLSYDTIKEAEVKFRIIDWDNYTNSKDTNNVKIKLR